MTSIEELGSELIVHLNIDAIRVDSGDPDAVEDFGLTSNAVAKFEAVSAVRSGAVIRWPSMYQAPFLRSRDTSGDLKIVAEPAGESEAPAKVR